MPRHTLPKRFKRCRYNVSGLLGVQADPRSLRLKRGCGRGFMIAFKCHKHLSTVIFHHECAVADGHKIPSLSIKQGLRAIFRTLQLTCAERGSVPAQTRLTPFPRNFTVEAEGSRIRHFFLPAAQHALPLCLLLKPSQHIGHMCLPLRLVNAS